MKKRQTRLPKGVYLRGHTFYIDLRVDGARIRRVAGETLEEAQALLSELRGDEVAPSPSRANGSGPNPPFDRLVRRYLARTELYSKPSSIQSATSSCKRLLEHFGSRLTGNLTEDDLERFIAHRLESVSREAVNRDLRYLKALLRLAADEGALIAPPFKVSLLRTTRRIPTILTPAEIRRLLAAADYRLRPLLMTAAMTGLRHSELVALDWSDVDLGSGAITVRAKPEIGFSPKSHAERQVPLNEALSEALTRHRDSLEHVLDANPVFQRNPRRASRWESSALCSAVRETFQRAGLYHPKRRPGLHMLRRSFASHVLARKADIETVRELGGWSGLAVVERYVASTTALKREAVNRLDFLTEQNAAELPE